MKKLLFFIFSLVLISYHSNGTKELNNATDDFVFQSRREIPVIQSVDIVVIGGSTSAVSAAISAAEQGASVFLVASKPYLGEDLCSTLRLEIDKNRVLHSRIENQIFKEEFRVTPLDVKATLNKALVEASIEFVFGSYVTDVLWDEYNQPSGVVIANRGGRQAIKAKTIIDATNRAWVCRMAGAEVYPWEGSEIEFQRTVVMPGEDEETYITRKLKIPMTDLHFPSFANAEIIAREKTYTEGQLRASESLFHIPPDPIVCKKNAASWGSNSEINIGHFQVKDFTNLFVLNGCADIPRSAADSLLKPAAMCAIASVIGKSAAKNAIQKEIPTEVFLRYNLNTAISDGDIKEVLSGLRPTSNIQQTIISPDMNIPVLGHYDVVVIGGGTSGAPAAIATGWWGMKVLVVEYLEGLGGIGTLGMIGKPYHGQKVGFAAEVPFPKDNIEPKMEWYRSEIKKVGGDIWLGVTGAGAYVINNVVEGAVVSTPEGRGVITAGVVIDASGNADIAIAAGADYMYGDIEGGDIALQGTGLSSRPLKGNYYNSDYLLVDETDMKDVWRTLVSVHITKASEGNYDAVPIIQNRERRRIIGDYVLDYLDQIAGRTYPDAIVYSRSDYDSHGYPSSPYFALLPHDSVSRKKNHPAPGGDCFTPYRCLLPKGLEGILVTGLGISMDRDASAMVRMQLDLANQGYAAGVAAMLAITNEVRPRNINVRELQKILVEKGNLPDSVLAMEDSFPLSDDVISQAVKFYGEATNPESAGKPLAIILSHKEKALPFIKAAYEKANGRTKLLYAQVLGMCGQKEGIPTLLADLENFSEWDEKIYQGSMADYAHLPTPIDAVILSLGYSGDVSVLPSLLKLVDKLDQNVTLSHHRSIALALEKIADSSAVKPLADLFQKPGMKGHAMLELEDVFSELDNDGKGSNPVKNSSNEKRTRALREIVLARALYKCGDYKNVGEDILESYQKDMRGLFARHADQVLKQKLALPKKR